MNDTEKAGPEKNSTRNASPEKDLEKMDLTELEILAQSHGLQLNVDSRYWSEFRQKTALIDRINDYFNVIDQERGRAKG